MKECEDKVTKILDNAKDDIMVQCAKAYQKGYFSRYKQETPPDRITDKDIDEAYNRGLNDAWDAVKKIIEYAVDGGYSPDVLREIFGESIIQLIFKHNTAVEAIAKIKAYEDKQKQDAEIKVGDEVMTELAEHGVAIRDTYYLGEDKEPFTLVWFGTHMSSCPVNELAKTGKHYPQIAEVLEAMKGEC